MNKLIKELVDRGNVVVIKKRTHVYEFNVNGETIASASLWDNFE